MLLDDALSEVECHDVFLLQPVLRGLTTAQQSTAEHSRAVIDTTVTQHSRHISRRSKLDGAQSLRHTKEHNITLTHRTAVHEPTPHFAYINYIEYANNLHITPTFRSSISS